MLWNWIVTFPWIPALYTGIFSTGLCLWVEVHFLVCSFYDSETLNVKRFFLVFPTCASLIHEILLYKALLFGIPTAMRFYLGKYFFLLIGILEI